MSYRRRNVSRRRLAIKPWRALLAAFGLASGCQPFVGDAPFRVRPDSVEAADLRGPFDGQVVDSGSGKPVDGATVVASWSLRTGRGLSGPAGARVIVVETDADGRYRVPRFDGRGLDYRLIVERFTLVIYKRGHVGWRSDLRFPDLSRRSEFTQAANLVRLERLPPDVSHARHLAYVGTGGPLLPRLDWELALAAGELAPAAEAAPGADAAPGAEPAPAPPRTHLDARVLLSPEELGAVSGGAVRFTVEPLPDVPSSPGYDSVHFRATGQPERFDAAIRAWKLPAEAAAQKFEQLAKELPAARESHDAGDRSFRSAEGPLLAVAALDRAQGVVIVLTCGKGLCSDHAQVAALLRRMWGRIGKMGQTTGEPPGSAPPPSAARPAEETPPAVPAPAAPARAAPPRAADRGKTVRPGGGTKGLRKPGAGAP